MQYNVNIKRGICGLVEYIFLLRKCLRKHKGRIRFVANNSQSLQNRNGFASNYTEIQG